MKHLSFETKGIATKHQISKRIQCIAFYSNCFTEVELFICLSGYMTRYEDTLVDAVWHGLRGMWFLRSVCIYLYRGLYNCTHKHLQIMICMSGNVNEFERKNNNHSHSRSSSNHRMIENCKKKGEQIRDGRILFKQNPITMKLELRVFYFQFSIYLFIFYLFIYLFVCFFALPAIHSVCHTHSTVIYRCFIGNEIYKRKCVYHQFDAICIAYF